VADDTAQRCGEIAHARSIVSRSREAQVARAAVAEEEIAHVQGDIHAKSLEREDRVSGVSTRDVPSGILHSGKRTLGDGLVDRLGLVKLRLRLAGDMPSARATSVTVTFSNPSAS
jgi:hypothetical protein